MYELCYVLDWNGKTAVLFIVFLQKTLLLNTTNCDDHIHEFMSKYDLSYIQESCHNDTDQGNPLAYILYKDLKALYLII